MIGPAPPRLTPNMNRPPIVPTTNIRPKRGGIYNRNQRDDLAQDAPMPQTPQGPQRLNPNDIKPGATGSAGGSGAPPAASGQTDDMAQKAMEELLSQGPRNTSGDEALINQMLQSTVGKGQADLNARLGAGGFGTSGALSAMSGDMRNQAARTAAQQVMGIRQGARDEWLDRVSKGLDAESRDRGLDQSDARYESYLKYLEALNKPDNSDSNGNGVPDQNDNQNPNTFGGDTQRNQIDGGQIKQAPGDKGTYADSTGNNMGPQGWDQYVGEDADYVYYIAGADGMGVKKGQKLKWRKTN